MERNTFSLEIEEPPGATLIEELKSKRKIFAKSTTKGNSSTFSPNRVDTQLKTINFRKQWFPEATDSEWHDWQWQLGHCLRNQKEISRIFNLSAEEKEVFEYHERKLPVAITPYYASLIDRDDSDHPLRKCVIPVLSETLVSPEESIDPLSERSQSPVPGIVHRYPDRVLFLVTNTCASYCRYCTRSRLVGHTNKKTGFSKKEWEKGIAYIRAHPEVRDVLLSGGDPLLLSEELLEWLLLQLRNIRHVEIIRIGTKTPVVLPQRITPSLLSLIKKFHPIWLSVHFTHPEEITPETRTACENIANAGIPMGSQTVLLRGVNNNVSTLKELFQKLLTIRVRPYYIYQCDPIIGTSHFRTSVQEGIEIIRNLRGFTTGYAVPTYIIDCPGGGGKIPISPDYIQSHEKDRLVIKNYQGNLYEYPHTFTEKQNQNEETKC